MTEPKPAPTTTSSPALDGSPSAPGGALGARAEATVRALQDSICDALVAIDGEAAFKEDPWSRPGGGGGRSRVLEGGRVFEKAGVSVSAVFGEVPEVMRTKMAGDGPTFFATGVSLVLHPQNPHVPTTHANFRFIRRGSEMWFGGGADLTPYYLEPEDARHFHAALRRPCDAAHPDFYPRFKAWCDRYFWNGHRGEARGVGGIFFDDLHPGAVLDAGGAPLSTEAMSLDDLWSFWEASGRSFLDAYLPIVERRMDSPFTDAERHWQLQRRGRYVEFNLLHDRGTKFGLQTNGRIESIFMSLPPLVRWDYNAEARPGSREAALIEVLRAPVDWLGDQP